MIFGLIRNERNGRVRLQFTRHRANDLRSSRQQIAHLCISEPSSQRVRFSDVTTETAYQRRYGGGVSRLWYNSDDDEKQND